MTARPSLAERAAAKLERRRREGLYRERTVVDGPAGVRVEAGGQRWLSFCSNDYLGLAADRRVADALRRGIERYGTGSGSAHLVNGHTRAHHDLELTLADFLGRERALLFSTGYMANLGVIAGLLDRGDLIVEDRLNHASLLDGGLLSGARFRRYAHTDAGDAGRVLDAHPGRAALVVTDGVFSMDGDLAPLAELAEVCRARGAWLAVDDAHGLGVIGADGRGSLAHWGLGDGAVPVLVGTLGKAFGCFGAFVAGDALLIEALIQRARTYIYTTAPPPAVAVATQQAVALARDEPWRRARLDALIRRFRAGAEQLGLDLAASPTPIQPILVGDAARAVALSERLREAGIWVTPIRPPTVPEGTARLRVSLSAEHTEADVDRLLEALDGTHLPNA